MSEIKTNTKKKKKRYTKPELKVEKVMVFGALCNGSTSGGRKATTALPSPCDAMKLLS